MKNLENFKINQTELMTITGGGRAPVKAITLEARGLDRSYGVIPNCPRSSACLPTRL